LHRVTTVHGKRRETVQYAITSLPRLQADAAFLLAAWRGRWAIENRAYYVLDTAFREDACRARTGKAPANLSRIRRAALNLLHALGVPNIAAALREHAYRTDRLFSRLGMVMK
jgi:predicted transposase YbfD/YdcC